MLAHKSKSTATALVVLAVLYGAWDWRRHSQHVTIAPPTTTESGQTDGAAPASEPIVAAPVQSPQSPVARVPVKAAPELASTTLPTGLQAPASKAAVPNFFNDDRTMVEIRPTALTKEASATAPAQARPAQPNGGAMFQDRRGLLGNEAASDMPVATSPVRSAQSFQDQRDLVPRTETSRMAERVETVRRTTQGLVVSRSGSVLPPFVPPTSPSVPQPAQPTPPVVVAVPEDPVAPAERRVADARPLPQGRCEPATVSSEPLDGGRMLVRIASSCRARQAVRFAYGDAAIARGLDDRGVLEWTLDLFAGTSSPLLIVFEDGASRELTVRGHDLDRIEKVALIWRAPVDLDLHAFEYGAGLGQPGHVWSHAASTAIAARDFTQASRRGRGFLSRGDEGYGGGDKIEVYTFFHHSEQRAGSIAVALEYASRGLLPQGETCGSGRHAEVGFQVISLSRGRVGRDDGVLTSVPCGQALSPEARFSLLHEIRVNR